MVHQQSINFLHVNSISITLILNTSGQGLGAECGLGLRALALPWKGIMKSIILPDPLCPSLPHSMLWEAGPWGLHPWAPLRSGFWLDSTNGRRWEGGERVRSASWDISFPAELKEAE